MEINEFIEKFVEAVEVEDASSVKPDTKFRELDEWSSLAVLSLLALAEEEFDVELKADDLKKANTLQELLTVIEEKQ